MYLVFQNGNFPLCLCLGRRRMAFLDMMLDMNAKGELSMNGVQEEVDTFTFEVMLH